jgi:hypothetical protein
MLRRVASARRGRRHGVSDCDIDMVIGVRW